MIFIYIKSIKSISIFILDPSAVDDKSEEDDDEEDDEDKYVDGVDMPGTKVNIFHIFNLIKT